MDATFDPRAGQALSQQAYEMEAKLVRPATTRERANMAVAQAEKRLADVKRAKEILDKNPELEELLDIMQRNHF